MDGHSCPDCGVFVVNSKPIRHNARRCAAGRFLFSSTRRAFDLSRNGGQHCVFCNRCVRASLDAPDRLIPDTADNRGIP